MKIYFEDLLLFLKVVNISTLFMLTKFMTGQRLVKSMGPLFDDVVIEPCLLHGDLWSGNISSDKNGEPVILDPACYCKSLFV